MNYTESKDPALQAVGNELSRLTKEGKINWAGSAIYYDPLEPSDERKHPKFEKINRIGRAALIPCYFATYGDKLLYLFLRPASAICDNFKVEPVLRIRAERQQKSYGVMDGFGFRAFRRPKMITVYEDAFVGGEAAVNLWHAARKRTSMCS